MASEEKRAALILIGLLGTFGARTCGVAARHGDDVVRAVRHVDDIPTPRVRAPAAELPDSVGSTRAPQVSESVPASSEVDESAQHVLETVQHGADVVTSVIDDDK